MKWLLDTNVLSEGVRARPNPKVTRWIASVPTTNTAISIVTLAELMDGAVTVRDERKREQYITWIEADVAASFRDRILPLTAGVLVEWLALARSLRVKGFTRDSADLLIVATARVHDLTLVSRNARHFAGTGVVVSDPWKDETYYRENP